MSVAPITYLARKTLGMQRSPEIAAVEIVTLCAAEEAMVPKASFLPEQLERVREFQAMGGHEAQLARISGGPVTHAATLAFRYRNARLLGGCLYAGGSCSQLTMARPPHGFRAIKAEMDKVSLIGTPISSIFFGHYLMDDSATTLMAHNFGPVYSAENDQMASWKHAGEYRKLMGLEVPTLSDAFLSEAWMFQDFGMNSHRRGRMKEVRQRLADHPADQSGHGVFIVRSSFGQSVRLLENELELADHLARRGFVVVNPMQESVPDIIRKVSGAALAVSVEGSALTHAYLTMQEKGAIITIQPPYRFDAVWKDFADLLDMKYGFVVAEGERHKFRVNIDEVMRTVDLIAG